MNLHARVPARVPPLTRSWLIGTLAGLMGGCAGMPPQLPGEPAWTSGRISVRIDATAGRPLQSMSAAFELRAGRDSGELRLNSPLGTRVATASWAPARAVLVTADGEQRFDSLQELSRRALGEALPLDALPEWLAGRPWTGAAHEAQASGFQQLGWRVDLGRRTEGWIEVHRSAPPAVRVQVKLDDPS